ncbi:MAG TPA: hypothetical protein VFS44_02580, partial [Gemmatimonadaceae bacterium]|nr:hypothetical protein [Gemmatimonadaceae bacterium]
MTPLSALRRLLPRPLPSRLAWRPVAVLAVSFALTALATHITSLAVRATDRVRFQSTAEHLQAVARERLEAYTTVLDAGSALVGTRPKLTHSEFQR